MVGGPPAVATITRRRHTDKLLRRRSSTTMQSTGRHCNLPLRPSVRPSPPSSRSLVNLRPNLGGRTTSKWKKEFAHSKRSFAAQLVRLLTFKCCNTRYGCLHISTLHAQIRSLILGIKHLIPKIKDLTG